jgi:hypothetical protein
MVLSAVPALIGMVIVARQTSPLRGASMSEVAADQLKHSSPIERSDKRRFFAVLHMGAIKSPLDAVRAAIVAEHRQAGNRK